MHKIEEKTYLLIIFSKIVLTPNVSSIKIYIKKCIQMIYKSYDRLNFDIIKWVDT